TMVKPPPGTEPPPGPDHWKRVLEGLPAFQTNYDESLKVGYKWYDAEKKPVLFPFGFGLPYTDFAYPDLKVTKGEYGHATFNARRIQVHGGGLIGQSAPEWISTAEVDWSAIPVIS